MTGQNWKDGKDDISLYDQSRIEVHLQKKEWSFFTKFGSFYPIYLSEPSGFRDKMSKPDPSPMLCEIHSTLSTNFG